MTGFDPAVITTLLIDLDDTVYPPTCGVWDAIATRIDAYLLNELQIPSQEVHKVRVELYHKYGTTLRGLQQTRQIDTDRFLEYVHDVPVSTLLTPDEELKRVLSAFPQRKVIFTNADRPHAQRVLNCLGLEACFEGVIDILDITPYCKPMPEAFEIALRLLNINDPRACVFIDDSLKNLSGAAKLGIRTVWVSGNPMSNPDPTSDSHHDAHVATLAELPNLFLNGGKV
jgi:putative hydrolase of the HAD superfamily